MEMSKRTCSLKRERALRRRARAAAMSRSALLAIFLLLFCAVAMPRNALYAQTPRRSVLILNSYHHGLSWTDDIVDSIRAVLLDPAQDPAADELEIYIEYMDTKRFTATPEFLNELYALYQAKYRDVQFELIMASDNTAFNFLREYADQLFPGVPVVFCGVNFFKESDLIGHERFTGVKEAVDIRSTLTLALTLQPNTRRIIVINDATVTGQAIQQEFEQVRPEFESRVEFVVYQDPTVSELRANLADLPDDTLIFMILLNRDRDGQFYTYEQSIDLVYSLTNRPIYGVWDFYLGHGLVGGMLANGRAQGEAAGEIAVRVLNGEEARTIPVVDSPNRYLFDYVQLRRFGISIDSLPGRRSAQLPGVSIVLNRPPSFTEKYGTVLIVATAILAVATGIVILQGRNLARQRVIQAALRVSNQELEEIRASLEQRVEARTKDLARRTQQLQIAAIVARDSAAVSDVGQLMDTIVDLISKQFGFYHAGIFLVDEIREFAVLRAASSEGGKRMLARKHKLRVAEQSIVGYVGVQGKPRIALDVGADTVWFDNPDLPETRSEMGLPLKVQNEVIGILDLQSTEPEAFTEEDIAILQVLADQLALAIQSARLFGESRQAMKRLETMYGEQLTGIWQRQIVERRYHYDGIQALPVSNPQEVLPEPGKGSENQLVVPIPMRDRIIGSVVLERETSGTAPWSPDEQELAKAMGVQIGLALENANLLEATRLREARERTIREIADRMQRAADLETLMSITAEELNRALEGSRAYVRLSTEAQLLAGDDGQTGEGDD